MVKFLRHQNIVWAIFVGMIAVCAVCYSAYALVQIYQYERLTTPLRPATLKWRVVREGEDHFVLQADYTYSFQGKIYEGRTYWRPFYLNEWAAQEASDRFSVDRTAVWIDPSSPIKSTLQKEFPLKTSIYASILCGLVIYLLWLDRYLARFY
ncbi:MAG: hypothetical protein H0V82_02125 [Candidatus Protochlamydia sp.]|nr:hypothetical protein [Candidatus Protochlamydia sp.]